MLLAVAVLTWMVVWMRRQARHIRGELERQVREAVAAGSAFALGLLAFVAVGREGLETALFLFAAVQTATPLATVLGGVVGLIIAVVLGYGLYRGSRRLNLRLFFTVTGGLLIVFAAGLLAHGIHEFQEAGLLPFVVEHVWDTNAILDEKAGLGLFLKSLFGYNGNPSLLEVIVYPVYLTLALFYLLRPMPAPAPRGQPAPQAG
ncbi:MAG: FTR1 family protein, partial [Chloroflexi bacterium]|nr:FTR1 family protein [Chloroflexota bacterium]